MANPENDCREKEEKEASQRNPEEVQRRHSDGSAVPYLNTMPNVDIRSTENNQAESRAENGIEGANANTPALTGQMNRIGLSERQQRSSRVRFSLDAESRPLPQCQQTFRSSLDVRHDLERNNESSEQDILSMRHKPSSEEQDDGSNLRFRRSSMNIRTDAPITDQPAQALASAKALPMRLEPISPTPGESAVNQTLAAKSRNRGYSLRRMIFNRNINPSEEESANESVELSSAQRSSQDLSQSTGTDNHLKSRETVAFALHGSVRRQHGKPYTSKRRKMRGAMVFAHDDSYLWKRAKQTYLFRESRRVFQVVQKLLSRINELPCSEDGRHISLDVSGNKFLADERTGKPYVGNSICSTRYTLWNFLPRQLVAQFSKLANL